MSVLETIFGGGVGKLIKDVVGTFKLSPEAKIEFEREMLVREHELALKDKELEAKLLDAQTREVEAASKTIQIEAQSQSWLPRNVRPLLLLIWGVTITANVLIPLIARFWRPEIQPLSLDEWMYVMTGIGYTGYTGFRAFEKKWGKAE